MAASRDGPKARAVLTGVVSVVVSSLAVLALLAFAVSLVAFLHQTSMHRSSSAWAVATGGFLVLVLLLGGNSSAISRYAEPTSKVSPSSTSRGAGPTDHDATVRVTRVVDGDTVDISPPVEGRSRVRLIGMDTPEVYFGIQPYGPEASAFAKRMLDGEEVKLKLDVQKIDPYGRLLAYVYHQQRQMFNETLLREGYAQVATFPPNVKFELSWGFHNLLGAISIQTAWLLESESNWVKFCKLSDCRRVISFASGEPLDIDLDAEAHGKRKIRKDRVFCKPPRGCKQNYDYRRRAGWEGYS